MKKKINFQLLGIAALSIISTLILITAVFYNLFQKEVIDNLKSYTNILKNINIEDRNSYISNLDSFRITIINYDGVVEFDSYVNIKDMDNHITRPEIAEAFKKGEGKAIRKSLTMSKNTFYYAIKLDNNKVLRIAKEAISIWSIFESILPVIIIMSLILFIICTIVARIFTKSLITPIEQMANNIDNIGEISVYDEFIPFVNKINKQHDDIVKIANMRQEFTANVSHELKTPLTSISGYAELIETGMAADKDIIRFAKEIHKNSKRLLTLINDIIRLSELDVVDREIVFEEIDLFKIAENCVNILQVNAENHNITLSLKGKSCFINANKEMMEELLYNLCDNAIRYNNNGGKVDVSVNQINNYVILEIQDTGIGISKEHQERIFERFYRVDKSRSKSTGGTGLGLAIVKHILVQHKADIELESEIGKGTKIKVRFKN